MKKIFFYLSLVCLYFSNVANAIELVPDSLKGKTLVFHVLNNKTPSNPNADMTYLMHFSDDKYSYQEIQTNNIVSGKYTYKVLNAEQGIAIITCQEKYQQVDSQYTMTLVAKDKYSGLYIYKQASGAIKPDTRLNFAYYSIIQDNIYKH